MWCSNLETLEHSDPQLTPNQPMERTLPCCALQRRSSARYPSHDLLQATFGYYREIP